MSIETMELFKKLQSDINIEDAVVIFKTKSGQTRIQHTDIAVGDLCVCKAVLDHAVQHYLFPPAKVIEMPKKPTIIT